MNATKILLGAATIGLIACQAAHASNLFINVTLSTQVPRSKIDKVGIACQVYGARGAVGGGNAVFDVPRNGAVIRSARILIEPWGRIVGPAELLAEAVRYECWYMLNPVNSRSSAFTQVKGAADLPRGTAPRRGTQFRPLVSGQVRW